MGNDHIMAAWGGKVFLKHIEILGFKSFADRTVVEFTDGITALLGPNGCGKSNIVDAIKWVLGEQSVRNMRAERMEDVIFSGSENRKALSVAEVTLVIANESGVLELERPEISIKRRIFKEGESEYFLNGIAVRLKEIRELFFDTGVGKSAYSIMEQGRIDQVLSHRPEERRLLFEEAAGITKFKMRGNEAERKLARTEDNMAQVENILREVRRNHETLKRQSEKTLEYRRLREAAFGLDRDFKLLQWKGIEENREKRKVRFTAKSKKHAEVVESIHRIKSALADELDAVNAMESRLIESQKQLYGIDLEKVNQEELARGIRERRNEAEESLKAASIREKNAVESLKELAELKKGREAELDGFHDRLKEIEGNIISCQRTILTAEKRIQGISDENETMNGDLLREEKYREGLQDNLRSLTDDIVRELDKRLGDSGYDRSSRRNLEERISDKLKELKLRLEGRSKLFGDQKQLAGGEEALELLDNAAADLASLGSVLEELTNLFEDYRASDAAFLEDFLAPEGIITQKRDLDEKINSSKERTGSLKERISILGEERSALSRQLQDSRESLEGFRVAQARTMTQAAATEDSLASLAREVVAEENRLGEIRQQLVTEDARIRSLDGQTEELMAKRKELEKKQEQLRQDMVGLETGISRENKKMTGREDKLKSLSMQRTSLELDRERIRSEMEHTDNEEKQLLEDFRDRYSRDLSSFVEMKETINQSSREIKDEQSKVKADLKALGQVNLMAPEEFAEVSERYNFLVSQLDDLQKGKEDLSRVTEEIRKESSTVFINTYKGIRDNFHEMFRRLFGGGRAELRLLDYDDPLNSGVEIYAQPPGKKLENISLLSGGEKSLCGVALLFATFMEKPSPFCILDEIDAALDETNIQRFIDALAEFGKMSQFVVITHNKKTVAGARNLLGVTMQESGVSRLLTLRLDGKEQDSDDEKSITTHQ